jgi:cystathionine beta-lyase/cystathionine gamma-synthase
VQTGIATPEGPSQSIASTGRSARSRKGLCWTWGEIGTGTPLSERCGLPGHPDRSVFERQCKSPGSTFSFEVKGAEAEAFAVLDRLKVIKLAVSLGGTETLASHPAAMTHSDIPEEERLRLGITPTLIRISVGIEDPDDLIVDLNQALG